MSTEQPPASQDRRLTPADVQNVRFTKGSVMRPGYAEVEVDRFLARIAQELSRSIAERAELRDEVHALRDQLSGMQQEQSAQVAPSDQAVRILASAQQTADAYVAEAEEFSRQMTSEARHQYEELTRQARENAGGIIQAAQEAAAKVGRGHAGPAATAEQATSEELQEQIAYLRAFGQATRTQLRAYLEALLADVEKEWGRADPAALPQEPYRTPAQRSDSGPADRAPTTFVGNTASEGTGVQDVTVEDVATAGARAS
jgi:DivIVA domain-containing protein